VTPVRVTEERVGGDVAVLTQLIIDGSRPVTALVAVEIRANEMRRPALHVDRRAAYTLSDDAFNYRKLAVAGRIVTQRRSTGAGIRHKGAVLEGRRRPVCLKGAAQ
jgi:hypothetical protein